MYELCNFKEEEQRIWIIKWLRAKPNKRTKFGNVPPNKKQNYNSDKIHFSGPIFVQDRSVAIIPVFFFK